MTQSNINQFRLAPHIQTETAEKGHFVYDNRSSKFIVPSSIIMIEADSNYSTIYLDNGSKILTSKTLKHWEIIFSSAILVRIHKSYLVNKYAIESIRPMSHQVNLKCGYSAFYSRRLKRNVQ